MRAETAVGRGARGLSQAPVNDVLFPGFREVARLQAVRDCPALEARNLVCVAPELWREGGEGVKGWGMACVG